MLVTGEEARAMGYNPDTMISQGGKYDIGGNQGGDLFSQLMGGFKADTDTYVNDLLSKAQGDTDFAIKQIKNAHDLAIGGNDEQTATFLESVADKLEEKIGRIPYDYQVGVQRTEASAKTALDRLAEDEKVWKQEKAITDTEAKTNQQEGLLKRGLLSGTREGATGLAGEETKKLDTSLQSTLNAYDRALGRSTADIGTNKQIALEDLKTGARRGVIGAKDTFTYGSEAQKRALETRKAELERVRKAGYETAPTYAANRVTQTYA